MKSLPPLQMASSSSSSGCGCEKVGSTSRLAVSVVCDCSVDTQSRSGNMLELHAFTEPDKPARADFVTPGCVIPADVPSPGLKMAGPSPDAAPC